MNLLPHGPAGESEEPIKDKGSSGFSSWFMSLSFYALTLLPPAAAQPLHYVNLPGKRPDVDRPHSVGRRFDFDTSRKLLPINQEPEISGLTQGDFSSNGHLDLAVLFRGETGDVPTLRLLMNNGEGFFEETERIPLPTEEVGRVAAADFDEDGNLDLGVTYTAPVPSLALFLGDGAGEFFPMQLYTTGGLLPLGILTDDFNADGHADLAVTNYDSFSVSILLGDGHGGLSTPFVVHSIGIRPIALVSGDFNRDSHLDLAVLNQGSQTIALLRGDGSGGFSPYQFRDLGILSSPVDIAYGDINGDGFGDLVVADEGQAVLRILFDDGTGMFPQLIGQPIPSRAFAVRTVDRDGGGGGTEEILAGVVLGHLISLQWNQNGGFDVSEVATIPRKCSGSLLDGLGLTLADFTGDRCIDALMANAHSAGGLTMAVGEGPTGFRPLETISLGIMSGQMLLGDLNSDSLEDLLVSSSENQHFALLADGSGGFSQIEIDLPSTPLSTADFNGDGHLDVVVFGEEALHVLVGDGALEFSSFQTIPFQFTQLLEVADVNGDGVVDIVATRLDGFFRTFFDLMLLDGQGGVLKTTSTRSPDGAHHLALADVDGDGFLDAAVLNNDGLSVHLSDGTRFRSAVHLGSGGLFVDGADLNGDGVQDLYVTGTSLDRRDITVYLSIPGSVPDLFTVLSTVSRPIEVQAADLDGDGHLDLVAQGSHNTLCGVPAIQVLGGDGIGNFIDGGGFWYPGVGKGMEIFDVDLDRSPDLIVLHDGRPLGRDDLEISLIRNRSQDHIASRLGNVNAAMGSVADVVFVNGSPGTGRERITEVGREEPLVVELVQPPAESGTLATRYALYVHRGVPGISTSNRVPAVGRTCISTPLGVQCRSRRPFWATLQPGLFGVPRRPSSAAPGLIASLPNGAGITGCFTIQGFIADRESPSGVLAVTNAVIVEIR